MPRLLAAGRHREILDRLALAESVTVEELAQALDVSRETIRRDLKLLAEQDRLSVVHGGALRRGRGEAPFSDRRAENRAGKDAIAALALRLVSPGMSVLLDSGSTTQALAEALSRTAPERLCVHTTSLANAQTLARLPGARIHLIGGEVDANDDATSGPEARRALARLSVDLAFVGVGGLDEQGHVTDYTRNAASLRGAMLGAADRAYFLADQTKFGLRLAAAIEGDGRAAGLIADRMPTARLAKALAGRGIAIVTP